jgi:outer membrane protein OmpA-like peptidoglycan-associated protein
MTLTSWSHVLAACSLVLRAETGLAQATIPLCSGLTIVGAVSEPEGDYEPMITVTGIDAAGVHLQYSAEVKTRRGSLQKVSVRRTVRPADLESATMVMAWFDPRASLVIAGTTAIGTSRAVLRALKAKGTADLGLFDRGSAAYPARRDVEPNLYQYQMVFPLRRVAEGPNRLPVLVNGVHAQLPVVHARGSYLGDEAELYVLDDEANPLGLRFQLASGGAQGAETLARTVKISHRCQASDRTTPLEQALLETGRADVYDLYFDFNSDRIREQSEPTLREIAELLRRHTDWRLAIEGHTDSIASDRFNLELSARRAAAVKAALTGRHGIVEGRLSTSGAGEGRPKARNDTPEGRARNRRVELVRLP